MGTDPRSELYGASEEIPTLLDRFARAQTDADM